MAVPKIIYSDNLRQGTDKLNDAIDQSNEAIDKSTTAETTANNADTKATTALSNSESTQTQLDTVVIDGDSSVEAAQARVSDPKGTTFTVLKNRLDENEAEFMAHEAMEASEAELGHVKVDGSSIVIDGDGVISSPGSTGGVSKTGDDMTGSLNMTSENGITFGNKFRLVFNSSLTTFDIEVI